MRFPPKTVVGLVVSLVLASSSGLLAARALGIGAERVVTINVATGPTGPTGPAGPRGEQGPKGDPGPSGFSCPKGFEAGELVINHPGGQVTLWTCLGPP